MSEMNKAAARTFLQRVWCAGELQLLDQILREDYIQHTPGVPQGREGVRDFIKGFHQQFDLDMDIRHEIAQGDHLVVHAIWTLKPKRGSSVIRNEVIDLFRFEDGLIAEHWDGVRDLSAA